MANENIIRQKERSGKKNRNVSLSTEISSRGKKKTQEEWVCSNESLRSLFIGSKSGPPRSCDQNTSQLRGLGEKCASSGWSRRCEGYVSQLRGPRGCQVSAKLVTLPS